MHLAQEHTRHHRRSPALCRASLRAPSASAPAAQPLACRRPAGTLQVLHTHACVSFFSPQAATHPRRPQRPAAAGMARQRRQAHRGREQWDPPRHRGVSCRCESPANVHLSAASRSKAHGANSASSPQNNPGSRKGRRRGHPLGPASGGSMRPTGPGLGANKCSCKTQAPGHANAWGIDLVTAGRRRGGGEAVWGGGHTPLPCGRAAPGSPRCGRRSRRPRRPAHAGSDSSAGAAAASSSSSASTRALDAPAASDASRSFASSASTSPALQREGCVSGEAEVGTAAARRRACGAVRAAARLDGPRERGLRSRLLAPS
jgi:hypothetical protein